CGAIPEGTIDSELFGHEKGSFTGASDARKGYFEVTDGGTIFLDEVGEMPLGTQARLLRVLENGEFIRVGSSKVQKTNVRVVAATNVKLLDAVEKGEFREDLYYRLNTVPIFVPPLRERGEDVELLFRKFATDFSEKHRVKPIKLDQEAKVLLQKFRFPGNIRQLKNLVEQMSLLESEKEITGSLLAQYLPQDRVSTPSLALLRDIAPEAHGMSERDLLYKILFDLKKDVIDLKKLVFEILNGDTIGKPKTDNYAELLGKFSADSFHGTKLLPEYTNDSGPVIVSKQQTPIQINEDIHDISHEMEDDTLSIQEKEKELIIRALKKHNNRRKNAALDLGISERTLYRKLKEYDLEHL
ncbi:MAG TPA: sigma 54-interacting transcriptional regulator, partial [Cytophagales bacterium]|nr:sigma 54-interacting transcriptional regulator [Cytophagales bacterium]